MSQRCPLAGVSSDVHRPLRVAGERPRAAGPRCARSGDRGCVRTPSPKGGCFLRCIEASSSSRKSRYSTSGNNGRNQILASCIRDPVEYRKQRSFAVNSLREIAARTGRGLTRRSAQLSRNISARPRAHDPRAMGAMPVVQEEIFAAERGDAGAFRSVLRSICRMPASRRWRCFADTRSIARRRNNVSPWEATLKTSPVPPSIRQTRGRIQCRHLRA